MRAPLVFTASAILSTALAAQTPPGACEVNDTAFTTREGGCQDQATNLVWSAITPNARNWSSAVSYCSNLVEGGYSDWRLPTLAELVTVDQNGAATHLADPQDLMWWNFHFWSSSTRGNRAWAHNFFTNADLLTLK